MGEQTAPELGYVYLSGRVDGCYKIGLSNDPKSRLEKVGTMLPVTLEVRHQVATINPRWLERIFHRAFASVRIRGEWFRLTDADVSLFRSITRADEFADLPAFLAPHAGSEPVPRSPLTLSRSRPMGQLSARSMGLEPAKPGHFVDPRVFASVCRIKKKVLVCTTVDPYPTGNGRLLLARIDESTRGQRSFLHRNGGWLIVTHLPDPPRGGESLGAVVGY